VLVNFMSDQAMDTPFLLVVYNPALYPHGDEGEPTTVELVIIVMLLAVAVAGLISWWWSSRPRK
jgi:hypothetical protein